MIERTATELDLLIKTGSEIVGPHGDRPGSLIHVGDLYVFQPFDEDTRVLTDNERIANKKRNPAAFNLALLKHKSHVVSNHEGRKSRSIRSAEQALVGLETDVSSLLARVHVTAGPYRTVAVDFVIERMTHSRLVRLAIACTMDPSSLGLSDRLLKERAHASRSLRSSGKLIFHDGDKATLVSPYLTDGRVVRIDALTGAAKEEVDKASSKKKRRMIITKEVVGAVVVLPSEGRAVFKVLEDRLSPGGGRDKEEDVRMLTDGGRGSGCVCHQSSVLTTERLKDLIAEESKGEPVAAAAAQKVSDKRTLCELYELVLRKHRANALVS
jgi:hypothetical protein